MAAETQRLVTSLARGPRSPLDATVPARLTKLPRITLTFILATSVAAIHSSSPRLAFAHRTRPGPTNVELFLAPSNRALYCDAAASPPAAAAAAPASFSHGFLRAEAVLCEPWPSSTVSGISLMPGMGWPDVISSTMWANDVGYGASSAGGAEVVGADVGAEVGGGMEAADVAPGGGVCEGEGMPGSSGLARPLGAVVGTGEGVGAWAR